MKQSRRGHVSMGDNKHHRAYIRMKTDEALYRAGLISIHEMHPDADPSEDFSILQKCKRLFVTGWIHTATRRPAQQTLTRAADSTTLADLENNIASKALTLGYESALESESYTRIVRTLPVKNYQAIDIVRGAAVQVPPNVIENGEVTLADIADEGREQTAILNYVENFAITRQARLNDDLNALAVTPSRFGAMIARGQGDLVIGTLTANGLLQDGVALFSTAASRGNLASSGAAPSVTTVEAGYTAMAGQTRHSRRISAPAALHPRFTHTGWHHCRAGERDQPDQ